MRPKAPVYYELKFMMSMYKKGKLIRTTDIKYIYRKCRQ